MSGIEIVGAISAVLGILDVTVKVCNGASKDLKLGETFKTVMDQLPILQQTLQVCKERFEPIEATLSPKLKEAISNTIESCREKSEKLQKIFRKTIPGPQDKWFERYAMAARKLGKGNRVEELMQAIIQDTQHLVNYNAVKSASPELYSQLDDMMKKMEEAEPSLPDDDGSGGDKFVSYGGQMTNLTGAGAQYNSNSGSGMVLGSLTGNPVFTFGPVLPAQTDFAEDYSYTNFYPVNKYVERHELDAELRSHLRPTANSNGTGGTLKVIICGLGGAGKSQLVFRYVQKYRQEYKAVFFIDAGHQETIDRDYIEIHRLLVPNMVIGNTTITVDNAIAGVRTWLQRQSTKCLWVMDSASEMANLNHYLPEARHLDLIIVTRNHSMVSSLDLLHAAVGVGNMSEDEATEVFRNCLSVSDRHESSDQNMRAIVRELGCLALAVTLAGSYVRQTPNMSLDLSKYLKNIQAQLSIHQSVQSTWEISWTGVHQRSKVAGSLLTLIGFLGSDNIYLELFPEDLDSEEYAATGSSSKLPEWTSLLSPEGRVHDHDEILSAFKILESYSLVSLQTNRKGVAYSVHKLVQSWALSKLDTRKQRCEWGLGVLGLLFDAVRRCNGDIREETLLVSHLMANFTIISSDCGEYYRLRSHHRKDLQELSALLLRLQLLDLGYEVCAFRVRQTTHFLGVEHRDTLTSYNDLAHILSHKGQQREQVKKIHEQTWQLRKKTLGRDHPDTLMSKNHYAQALGFGDRNFKEAEILHREVLESRIKVLGWKHADTLSSLNNLALSLDHQRKYEDAERMFRQTLKLRRETLGSEHPATLATLNNLAMVLDHRSEYEAAEANHRLALELRQKVLGSEHPETLASLNNLAIILSRRCKYEEAEAMLRQALRLREKVLGPDHYHTKASTRNLSQTIERRKYFEATGRRPA